MTFPARDTLAGYGGALVDLAEVTDPTTDRPADGENEALASVAAMTHTALQCWARIVTSATTPTLAITNPHDAAWGSSSGVAPVPARVSTGVFTLTWPTSITDELGDTQTVSLRGSPTPNAEGATAYHTQATVSAANVITLRVFDMAGTLTDAAGTTIWVGGL